MLVQLKGWKATNFLCLLQNTLGLLNESHPIGYFKQ